ncbi:ABC transporter substrate-binding protein [Haloarchaeobius sp. HRN-SO-5]|uniref:ABC transporter substrate-binding protein n=1 Tax=Haloarchaeobius sp. HRN-SO-5 TaxID=3446118 RepID=UPI003EB7B48A
MTNSGMGPAEYRSRRQYLKLAGVGGATALAGCLGGGGGTSGNNEEVHFITEESSPSAKTFINEAAAKFTEETDIPVTTEFTGLGSSFDQRIATLIRTGNAPEVAMAPGYLVTNWIRDDIAAPVTGVREAIEESWDTEYREKHRLVLDGEDYLAPLHINPSCQTYRTDIFEQAGVEPPTTFAEEQEAFPQLADSLSEGTSVGNFAFNTGLVGTATTHHRIDVNGVNMLSHSGDDPFSGFEVVLDQGDNRQRAIEALEHCKTVAEYSVDPQMGISSWASTYFTGKSAIGEYGGPRPLTAAYRENPEVARNSMLTPLAHGPSGDDPTYFSFLEGFSVLKNAKYPDAGRQFIEYLLTGDTIFGMLLNFAPLHNAPVLDTIYNDDRYRNADYMQENDVPDEVLDTLKNEIMPRGEPRFLTTGTPNPYIGALQGTFAIGNMGNAVAVQGEDPGAAVDQAAQTLRNTLNDVQG